MDPISEPKNEHSEVSLRRGNVSDFIKFVKFAYITVRRSGVEKNRTSSIFSDSSRSNLKTRRWQPSRFTYPFHGTNSNKRTFPPTDSPRRPQFSHFPRGIFQRSLYRFSRLFPAGSRQEMNLKTDLCLFISDGQPIFTSSTAIAAVAVLSFSQRVFGPRVCFMMLCLQESHKMTRKNEEILHEGVAILPVNISYYI